MRSFRRIPVKVIGTILLTIAALNSPLLFGGQGRKSIDFSRTASTTFLPIGIEDVVLMPENRDVVLFVELERTSTNASQSVSADDFDIQARAAQEISRSPILTFRITAAELTKHVSRQRVRNEMQVQRSARLVLLDLKFRVKAFKELHMSVIHPLAVNELGANTGQTADVRAFRVAFERDTTARESSLVLEVCMPDGATLARFHLPRPRQ